jgi:predicted NAD/FAD-dependent oxidoreductase
VSASDADQQTLQAQVLAQAHAQLGLALQALQTVVEKRATFACTPGLRRPAQAIAHGLIACGDYVEGPYPATLEGAVRSGMAAVRLLSL